MKLRVAELCKQNKTTIKDLAEKIGISNVGLSQQINGNPTVETLEKIAAALNVPISELFEQPKSDVITCPNCGARLKVTKE